MIIYRLGVFFTYKWVKIEYQGIGDSLLLEVAVPWKREGVVELKKQ